MANKKFIGAVVVPHPPIVVAEIGQGKEQQAQATIKGLQEVAQHIKKLAPQVLLCITPHGNVFSDGICVLDKPSLRGDFSRFGNKDVVLEKPVNQDLVGAIGEAFLERGINHVLMDDKLAKQYNASTELDHGCLVPLLYIEQQYSAYQIVHVSVGRLSKIELYEAGMALRSAIDKSELQTLVVASGDLSHTLLESGPYGHHPAGEQFDQAVVDVFKHQDFIKLFQIPEDIVKPAATCAMESLMITIGMYEGSRISSNLLSYEGPFGVGYLNAILSETVGSSENDKHSIASEVTKIPSMAEQLVALDRQAWLQRTAQEDDYVKAARLTIEQWVKSTQKIDAQKLLQTIQTKKNSERLQNERAGVFVSLHKQGQLRGCIGTIEPTTDSIIEEIIRNAIAAATEDPRFAPVREQELQLLEIKVDILHPPQKIERKSQLDVEKYGVIVEADHRRGLLLPNLEGVNNIEDQVGIAKQKAGIGIDEKVQMYRFEVERHS